MVNLPGLITNSFIIAFILGYIFMVIKVIAEINNKDGNPIPDIIALILLTAFILTIFF